MIRKNKQFYSKGKLNFLTFANDKYISRANAIEFANRFKHNDEIIVWEFGCGTGQFALNFLDELKNNKEVYKKTQYLLFDFSKRFLTDAKRLLSRHGHKIETVYYEAPDEIPRDKVHYVRMNEFWDDLYADIYTMRKGKVYNIEKKKYENNPGAREFLKLLPDDSSVVLNTSAAKHLFELNKKLVYSGVIDVFDYGFNEIELPFDTSLGFVKREAEHVTYDINFIYMKAFARALGLNVYVEMQDNYVNSVFSGLRAVEMKDGLYYMNDNEIKKNKDKLKLRGYSQSFITGAIKEENEYYHMRIWK